MDVLFQLFILFICAVVTFVGPYISYREDKKEREWKEFVEERRAKRSRII